MTERTKKDVFDDVLKYIDMACFMGFFDSTESEELRKLEIEFYECKE